MEKRILHMNSSKHCFEELSSGRRREEVCPLTAFWQSRLQGREYDEIHFRNGYAKDAPFLRVEYKGAIQGQHDGNPCWRIKLGKVLEVRR